MSFSNLYQQAGYNASDNVQRLLALIGDEDPLAVFQRLPSRIEELTRGLDEATLRKPEREGKWSMNEVVQHLADAELFMAVRYRLIAAHETPPITGYDQDALARTFKYASGDLNEAFDLLRAVRRANVRILSALSPEERQKQGLHSERGPESIERLMKLHAAHDLVHTRQLERVRAAVA